MMSTVPGIFSHVAILITCLLAVITPVRGQSPLPSDGVVFDDFRYQSAAWVSESNTGQPPPTGSLYGRNVWHTSETGQTTISRAWYQYLWQERSDLVEGAEIRASEDGGGRLTITFPAGYYPESRTSGSGDPHIASGFAARRGTWAARLTFSDLDPAQQAGLIQAFWLQGLVVATAPDGSRRWNEVDFEWNNRFRGRDQERPYLHTGYTVGRADHVFRNLSAPGVRGEGTLPSERWTWSCNYARAQRVETLREDQCTRFLAGDGSSRNEPLQVTLLMHVSDEGVYFDVEADGPEGRIVSRTVRDSPTTTLPLIALFSQHISADSRLAADRELEVDWFYFTPRTDVTIADVHRHVAYIRDVVGAPRFNSVPHLSLERPERHLPGEASTYGLGRLTTPLTLDFSLNPDSARPGQSLSLSALPPLRHGHFTYQWRYRTRDDRGRTSRWRSMNGHFAAEFTVPRQRGVAEVEFEVTVSELADGQVLNNSFVRPVTRSFSLRVAGR